MITITAVGMLFPAIPLTIAALNFQYTSLAGLMRQLHHEIDKSGGGYAWIIGASLGALVHLGISKR